MTQFISKSKTTLFRKTLLAASLSMLLATSAQAAAGSDGEVCFGKACSEADINAPVKGSVESLELPISILDMRADYRFPTYDSSWGLSRATFAKAQAYYEANRGSIPNQRYVTIGDFSQHASKKRMYLFDLQTGKVERHNFAHGAGSHPDSDGYATKFSNIDSTHMSSIGFYLTDATYQGKHGYSLRLRGLSSTNSNAYARAIVLHPANYVSDAGSKAGRSWGCPAVDPKYSSSIINRLRGGSLLLLDKK